MRHSTARALVLLTALLFSTGGAGIKATSLTNWQVATLRSGIAAVVLLAFTGRGLRVTSRTWLVGLAYAGTLVTFVTANKLTTAANTVFFQGTAPLFIALIGPWWLGERLPRRDYPVLVAIALGVACLFAGHSDSTVTAPDQVRGNIIGAASGFFWCLTIMGLRWVGKHDPRAAGSAGGSAAILGNVVACAVCLPFALPFHDVGVSDVVMVGYLGIFQIGMAYVLLTRAMTHLPAVEASILLLLEPAVSPIWAWLFHAEVPGRWPLVGGILIVGSTAWKTLRDVHRRARSSTPGGA